MRLAITLLILFPFTSFGQNNQTARLYNPSSVSTPRGYSHVAEVDLGTCRMLIISGQVPLDKQGNLVGKGDLAKQTEQVYTNIKNIVEEAGGKMIHVIKTGIFMVDASQIDIFRSVRNRFVNVDNPPASTLVQVSRLFREDVLIEIEATAIIPK